MAAQSPATAGLDLKVTRGLNDTRLAILGIMASIAVNVAFGVTGVSWWLRVVVGVAVFFGLAGAVHFLLRCERATSQVMGFAHWVLGRKH